MHIMRIEQNEKTLMERAAAGDRRAFRCIFDAYYPQVYGFIKSILKTDEDASDIAQEVFIKLWLMRAALPDISSLRSYIYRMSLNQTISYLRRNKIETASSDIDIAYDQLLENQIDMKDKEAFISDLVSKMPEQRRKIFVLSRLEQLSNDEIASKLNIKKKTVENHLNLALRELRTALSILATLTAALLFLF